jgi:predicted XRE-type DNA-binding protein
MVTKSKIKQGSGNVFADLGVAEPERALAKAELAFRINTIIEGRGLKQVEAAELLGIDQAKVSALHRGRIAGFSTDRLIQFLNVLDRDVEIVVRPKPASHKRGCVSVAALQRRITRRFCAGGRHHADR